MKQHYIYVVRGKNFLGKPVYAFSFTGEDFQTVEKCSNYFAWVILAELVKKLNLKKGEQVRIPINTEKAVKI